MEGPTYPITSNGLDDLWENQQLPTREAVARQFTDKTSDEQQQLLGQAMQQWQSENTRLRVVIRLIATAAGREHRSPGVRGLGSIGHHAATKPCAGGLHAYHGVPSVGRAFQPRLKARIRV